LFWKLWHNILLKKETNRALKHNPIYCCLIICCLKLVGLAVEPCFIMVVAYARGETKEQRKN